MRILLPWQRMAKDNDVIKSIVKDNDVIKKRERKTKKKKQKKEKSPPCTPLNKKKIKNKK